jgi:hypothetical protein
MKILDAMWMIIATLREMEAEDQWSHQTKGTPTLSSLYSDINQALRNYCVPSCLISSRSICDGGLGAPSRSECVIILNGWDLTEVTNPLIGFLDLPGRPEVRWKCHTCHLEFSSFYDMNEHNNDPAAVDVHWGHLR